jgi:hypothetical protein
VPPHRIHGLSVILEIWHVDLPERRLRGHYCNFRCSLASKRGSSRCTAFGNYLARAPVSCCVSRMTRVRRPDPAHAISFVGSFDRLDSAGEVERPTGHVGVC